MTQLSLARTLVAALVGLGPAIVAVDAECTDAKLEEVGKTCEDAGNGISDPCVAYQKVLDCHVPSGCCPKGFAGLKTAVDSLDTTCPSLACTTAGATCPAEKLTQVGTECKDAGKDETDECKKTQAILTCHVPSGCCDAGFTALKGANAELTTTCPTLSCTVDGAAGATCPAETLTQVGKQCEDAGKDETDECKKTQAILDCHVASGCCDAGFTALKGANAELTTTCPTLDCAGGSTATTVAPASGAAGGECPADKLAEVGVKCQDAGKDETDACKQAQAVLTCHVPDGCCDAGFAALKGADANLTTNCPTLACTSGSDEGNGTGLADRVGRSMDCGATAAMAALVAMSAQLVVPTQRRG